MNRGMTEELSHMDIEHDFDNCLRVFEKWYGMRENAYMANETGIKTGKPPFSFDIYEKDSGGYAGVALKYMYSELSGQIRMWWRSLAPSETESIYPTKLTSRENCRWN